MAIFILVIIRWLVKVSLLLSFVIVLVPLAYAFFFPVIFVFGVNLLDWILIAVVLIRFLAIVLRFAVFLVRLLAIHLLFILLFCVLISSIVLIHKLVFLDHSLEVLKNHLASQKSSNKSLHLDY